MLIHVQHKVKHYKMYMYLNDPHSDIFWVRPLSPTLIWLKIKEAVDTSLKVTRPYSSNIKCFMKETHPLNKLNARKIGVT